MKKFRYRLDRVLQYREVVKAEKKRTLGLVRQELEGARQMLQRLEAELLADRIGDGATMTIEDLQLLGAYADRLRARIVQQGTLIVQCEEKVALALSEYIEAAKESESLVKHKEVKHTEYREVVEKEDQKFMDELTTQRMGRSVPH